MQLIASITALQRCYTAATVDDLESGFKYVTLATAPVLGINLPLHATTFFFPVSNAESLFCNVARFAMIFGRLYTERIYIYIRSVVFVAIIITFPQADILCVCELCRFRPMIYFRSCDFDLIRAVLMVVRRFKIPNGPIMVNLQQKELCLSLEIESCVYVYIPVAQLLGQLKKCPFPFLTLQRARITGCDFYVYK